MSLEFFAAMNFTLLVFKLFSNAFQLQHGQKLQMIKKGLCIRIYLAEIRKNDSRVIVSQIHYAAYVI